VKQILAQCKAIAIEPHDYQCEGICQALDVDDVVATMATGAGKTGLLSFLMLAVRAISQNPSLALQNRTFPKDPIAVGTNLNHEIKCETIIGSTKVR
jgi:hypothetical protein